MNYKGIVKGKTIELEETLPYEEGQAVSVSVEPLNNGAELGSPNAIMNAMRQPPHLSPEDVDELERVIEESKLPMQEGGVFDKGDR